MLYSSLVESARALSSRSLSVLPPLGDWERGVPGRRRQWGEMLGLVPPPPRGDLKVEVVGRLEREGCAIEKLSFQPFPDVRIAANLYLPKNAAGKVPAVVYLCGHARPCKFHYQQHPRWFAEHGYAAMALDTIQLGESDGEHHGTYSRGWWHWYSQGYTPAGFEVWAAMRAADYLQSRPEVDPERLGVTGNSGGGSMSWFAGALDPRFKVVAPSCQTGNISQHIQERTLDGHCDCSFWINTHGWDFPDVGALIVPRPLLIASATEDALFRPYAFGDLYQRLRRLYILHGKEDNISLVDAVTPHGYSPKTRTAIFNWFERHLKGVASPDAEDVSDARETDEDLAVHSAMKPPAEDKGKGVDRIFVSLPAAPEVAGAEEWRKFQAAALAKLRQVTFRQIPEALPVPECQFRREGWTALTELSAYEFETEPGVKVLARVSRPRDGTGPCPLLAAPMFPESRTSFACTGAGNESADPKFCAIAAVETRGTGNTSIGPGVEWHARRAYPLLGKTLHERRTFDFLTALQVLRARAGVGRTMVYGEGYSAVVAIYAALLDVAVVEVVLKGPVQSHWDGGPEFLNVLKVGDLPVNLALAFPRPISFVGDIPEAFAWTVKCYGKLGMGDKIRRFDTLADWRPAQ